MLNQKSNPKRGCKRNIIILSEFIEGAWESIRFSMENLIDSQHGLVYVQAYRKPDVGQSLLNNFIPILERMAKNELAELKRKTLSKFTIDEDRISICPFEGDLVSFIRCKQMIFNPDFLVISMKKAFPGAAPGLAKKVSKLTSYVTRPLFILPDILKKGPVQKVLYLSGTNAKALEKISCLARLQLLNKNMAIDLRLLSGKKPTEILPDFTGQAQQLFDAGQLQVQSDGITLPASDLAILSGKLQPDLVILDQDLTASRADRRKLKLKNWVEKKHGLPLLIF